MSIIKQSLISKDKYSLKCPYEMTPIGICVHNTYNDAPAKNEASYMKNNNSSTSFHIAVDDVEALQLIPFNRNAWASGDGNGQGNRKHIHIEICYSKSGGNRFIESEKNAVKVIVEILNKYEWGIDRVKKHQDFANKYCPHRTLDMGWNRFLEMIKNEMKGESQSDKPVEKPQANNSPNIKTVAEGKAFVGNRCKELQQKLIKVGYDCGGFGADGMYGKGTHEDLIAFQKKYGLVVDGLAGNNTFKKLDEVIKNMNKPTQKPSTSSGSKYKLIAQKGKCTWNTSVQIREKPSTKAKSVGQYSKRQTVVYDYYVDNEGYRWISWIGGSGKRRYSAVRVLSNNKKYGNCV